jgi:hypothetical protein
MTGSAKRLSKSRFLSGTQCAKRLWIETWRPTLVPKPDAATQAIFDQGHTVGELARELFPRGVEIDRARLDWESALAATREAMLERLPIYEAAFESEGAACRVDILVPVPSLGAEGDAGWDLYEVKSGSSAKPENVEDVAFQTFVLRGAGVALRRSHLVHLDSTYLREGELEVARLFTIVDLTAKIEPLLPEVARRVANLQSVQAQTDEPQVSIGPHCETPYGCPLIPSCWSGIPEESVFTLTRAGKKKWELFARGIVDLVGTPDDFKLNARQQVQVAAARHGGPHIDSAALRHFLAGLTYPLYYLDFETFALAVPPFSGTRPYQAIPFQYSLHVVDQPHAEPRVSAFLAEGDVDPRSAFLTALRRDLGEMTGRGSIVAFNAIFERGRLAELAAAYPEHAEWAERARGRFVDLLVPFRDFAYYHPSQLGSASLKRVLPVLGARGYDELEIQAGDLAALEFVRSNLASTSPEERDRIRAALLEYCGRDTEGMVEIVAALERLVGEGLS